MDEDEFEGTAVLELLAAVGGLDAFAEAVDADDRRKAVLLMRRAKIDTETIHTVLRRMANPDDDD